jgi:hypothetical protein
MAKVVEHELMENVCNLKSYINNDKGYNGISTKTK